MLIGECQTDISFSQTSPITALSITCQSALRIVARNRILIDAPVDASQRDEDCSGRRDVLFWNLAQLMLQQADRFWMISGVVVGDTQLHAQSKREIGGEIRSRLRLFVHRDCVERLA